MRCRFLAHLLAGAFLAPVSAGAQATVTTLDTVGTGGGYTAVAYGPDGLALISYYDEPNGALKVAHCQDFACTTAALAVLESPLYSAAYTSIAFGSDGRGLIGYAGPSGGAVYVKVAHCADAACSSATVGLAGPAGGGSTGIAVGADGLGVVAYADDTVKLAVAHCSDVACSALTRTSFPNAARDVALTILGDGLPFVVAAYAQVAMYHCQNAACTASGGEVILQDDGVGQPLRASVATGGDGLGILGVEGAQPLSPPNPPLLRVGAARCSDAACSTQSTQLVGLPDSMRPAVAVLPGDRPVLAFRHQTGSGPDQLQLARCATPECVGATSDILDTGLNPNSDGPSVAVSPLGGVLVTYSAGGHLKVAYLPPDAVPGNADLAIAISASPDPANPGSVLSYTLSVTNAGPDAATGVLVSDQLPAGLSYPFVDPVMCSLDSSGGTVCALGTIPSGESRSVTVGGTPVIGDLETLVDQASVSHSGNDPNPLNDTASLTTAVNPWLRMFDTAVVEGTGGTTNAVFLVLLSRPSTTPVSVSYSTQPGTATAGVDYVPTSGTLSFAPGTVSASFAVPIVTDSLIEDDEEFVAHLSNPQGAGLWNASRATILDDDAPPLSKAEVNHGTSLAADMGPGNAQAGVAHFRVAAAPYSSYEALVDAVSPDVAPVDLVRLAPDGQVMQVSYHTPGSARLPWINYLPLTVVNETLRVTGACGAACDAGDRYRIRLNDTTVSVPRFDNTGSQRTVVIVSNPTPNSTSFYVFFFDESGQLLVSTSLQSVQPRGSLVLDTTGAWAHGLLVGRGGSARIASWAPYGALTGKAVILDPVSGTQTEAPLAVRPR